MKQSTSNFSIIQSQLQELLRADASIFSAQERDEVESLISAAEIGLALQTLVDIIFEEKKHISSRTYGSLQELARSMKIVDQVNWELLRAHISPRA